LSRPGNHTATILLEWGMLVYFYWNGASWCLIKMEHVGEQIGESFTQTEHDFAVFIPTAKVLFLIY
jgi:hypothetical protein